MSPTDDLEAPLVKLEQLCLALAAALARGEPAAVYSTSLALREGAAGLAQQMAGRPTPPDAALRQRVQRVAEVLSLQRSGLARHSAAVERTLHVLVPATREQATYAGAAGYGGAPRGAAYRAHVV